MKKLILLLTITVSLFAKNDILVDSKSQLIWQDNYVVSQMNTMNYEDAIDYCNNLYLNDLTWRLPSIKELKLAFKIKDKFSFIFGDIYWSFSTKDINNIYGMNMIDYGEVELLNKLDTFKVKCVSHISNEQAAKAKKEYSKANIVNTIKAYQSFILKYPNAIEISEANKNINVLRYNQVKQINTVKAYRSFILKYPNIPQINKAKQDILLLQYNKVKKQNTIKAYQSFILKYPKAPQVRKAKEAIYTLIYNQAKSNNTLKAYIELYKLYPKRFDVNKLLKFAKLKSRFAFKEGPIGKRYVPSTSTSYTTYESEHITVNGRSHTIGKNKTSSYSSGGYDENVYGFKAIYGFKNSSKNYYIVNIKTKWSGTYSKYMTGSYGAWSDKSGSYSKLKSSTQPSSWEYGFALAPKEKTKFQFEVGETKPTNLRLLITNIVKIDKSTYQNFNKVLSSKCNDIALLEKYIKDDRFKRWHKRLKTNKQNALQRLYAKKVQFRFVYDKEDYDPDFENEVKMIVSAPFNGKITYKTDFGTKDTITINKVYTKVFKLQNKSISSLKARVISVEAIYK